MAKVIGYSNPSDVIAKHVDDDEKEKVQQEAHTRNAHVVKTTVSYINESGLYSLIFSSKMEKAKAFRKWVTNEVLPSIHWNEHWANSGLGELQDTCGK